MQAAAETRATMKRALGILVALQAEIDQDQASLDLANARNEYRRMEPYRERTIRAQDARLGQWSSEAPE